MCWSATMSLKGTLSLEGRFLAANIHQYSLYFGKILGFVWFLPSVGMTKEKKEKEEWHVNNYAKILTICANH